MKLLATIIRQKMTSVQCLDHTWSDSEPDIMLVKLSGIAMSWRKTMPSVRSPPMAYLVRVKVRVRVRVRVRDRDRVRDLGLRRWRRSAADGDQAFGTAEAREESRISIVMLYSES